MKQSLPLLVAMTAVLGCGTFRQQTLVATATLEPRSGSQARGTVTFTEASDGTVTMESHVTDVPDGTHGFHIHEVGDCSAADATSAGPHFNPTAEPHAGPTSPAHHAGDFGNVAASGSVVHDQMTTTVITLSEGPRSVVGRAVVLHADPDDLTSQPAGNAGKRIACGVITLQPGR